MNQLSNARSAYLRSAQHQPVDWQEWGPEAFARAQAEDKPILLDIGAVWCHWCHVMDRESYEDADTAHVINHHFIAIKVDRDDRPEVDARYQAAVAAISGQGGWPLTAFLTPEGKPFFGGTYFPPVDGHGRPSLRRVLHTMAEAFMDRREEVNESAGSVMAAIEENEAFDSAGPPAGAELLEKMIASALGQFDPRFGGFGSQPKFPHAAVLDLLLDRGVRQGGEQAGMAVLVTLEKMSKGGIYDQLAGGFHRYSVDERWVVPHFEKMSYDNSELLRNFIHAYQTTGEQECARIARECIGWIDEAMSDHEQGGFFASQDADYSPDDDGDYFTWTRAEAAAVLSDEEMRVAEPFFDIGPIGDMQHNHEKNVLHMETPLPQVAKAAGLTVEVAAGLIATARRKLYAARRLRPAPYTDRTIYSAWNAMMCSAYLESGRVLADGAVTQSGLRALDRALATAWDGSTMAHVVSYGEVGGKGGTGVLDDYVFTGHAALDVWEITGEYRYYQAALAIAEAVIARFYDTQAGGFFDTEITSEPQLGALGTRRKPLQDSPTPAGNPMAAGLLLRLAELAERDDFLAKAAATLQCFSGAVEHFGLYAASYALTLRRMLEPATRIVVFGADAVADSLERAALRPFVVGRSVVRLRAVPAELPPALTDLVQPLVESCALVCRGRTCLPPARTVEELRQQL